MKKILLILSLIIGYAFASAPIVKTDLGDGTSLVRVYFNYEDPTINTTKLRGVDGIYTFKFSIPNKWEILDAKGYIVYTPSIILLKDLSSIAISLNNTIITQFKIFDFQNTGINFSLDKKALLPHNELKFEVLQHYTYKCEDSRHSGLWSELNTKKSYLEFHIKPKAVKEMLSSIKLNVFDNKQYNADPINYVLLDTNDTTLKNYALFTSVASITTKYRLENITISKKLDLKKHNLIIANKEEAKALLSPLKDKYIINEKPSLSLFFNKSNCNSWINDSSFTHIKTNKKVSFIEKEAFSGKSLFLNNQTLEFENMHIQNKKAISISFWFQPKNKQPKTLFSFKNYSLLIVNNYIGFNTNNHDLYGGRYQFKKNKWYHITAIFHKNDLSLNNILINGEPLVLNQIAGSYNKQNAIFSSSAYLGNFTNTKQFPLKAYIDQFYLFDHSLTLKNAKKIYRYSLEHKKEGLSESLFLDDKLAHNINVIQNPYNIDKLIMVIISQDIKKREKLIYALYKEDLIMNTFQGIDIQKVTIPSKAKAYTAKNFVPTDKKVYFKELGYKTQLLKGVYPPKIKLKFKVYPDNHFDAKDKIKTNIQYILPSVINKDSVINTYINGNFAHQLDIVKVQNESQITMAANKLFNFNNSSDIPAYLLGRGYNEIRLDFSLIPIKEGICTIFNQENLVASVLDDSYIVLPKAKRWIEMPYMDLITSAQYPYSIYPDLQDTVVYLTNTDENTIASAMNFLFFLTQELGTPPHYIHITTHLTKKDKQKNIIAFGTTDDKLLRELSLTAPIKFNKNMIHREYPYIKRFTEHLNIINPKRTKKYQYKTSITEDNFTSRTMIMQMYRSTFNPEKTILLFSAMTPNCLNKGVTSIFKYKNRYNILGDTVIYDFIDEKGIAYNIKNKYIISKLNWIQTMSLEIGANPVRYILAFILFLIIIVWVIKGMLRNFKEEHHKDAE